jgi:hypothetical protein
MNPPFLHDLAVKIETANAKRRERILNTDKVIALLQRVSLRNPLFDYITGGTVKNAYGYPSHTTLAFAAWVDGRLYVNVGNCSALEPSPGRVWKILQPYGMGDMERKLRKWVTTTNPLEVTPEMRRVSP